MKKKYLSRFSHIQLNLNKKKDADKKFDTNISLLKRVNKFGSKLRSETWSVVDILTLIDPVKQSQPMYEYLQLTMFLFLILNKNI